MFVALFVIGVGLIMAGIVHDVVVAGNLENRAHSARVLEVSGIAVAFGSIFGAAGWAFSRRLREERLQRAAGPQDKDQPR